MCQLSPKKAVVSDNFCLFVQMARSTLYLPILISLSLCSFHLFLNFLYVSSPFYFWTKIVFFSDVIWFDKSFISNHKGNLKKTVHSFMANNRFHSSGCFNTPTTILLDCVSRKETRILVNSLYSLHPRIRPYPSQFLLKLLDKVQTIYFYSRVCPALFHFLLFYPASFLPSEGQE